MKTVLYDVGGVFHIPYYDDALRARFTRETMEFLKQNGISLPLSPEALDRLLADGAKAYKAWADERGVELPVLAVWRDFIFQGCGIPEERLAPIAEELSFRYNDRRRRDVRPHLKETVLALHAQGVRQGVVSNIISTTFIPHVLEEYGIAHYMECVVQSSEEGVRKPDARIFDIALARLGGVKREDCAYVGDTISRDIIGARNAGLGLVVQIKNPTTAHRDAKLDPAAHRPDVIIRDLCELPAVVAAWQAG